MYANRRNFRVCKESGSRNTMVTSDFKPEVEILPFRACAMKKMCNISLIYGRIAKIFNITLMRFQTTKAYSSRPIVRNV